MAADPGRKREITPEDDPYTFEWPDDAREQRIAEREAERRAAEVSPAPAWLTALVIGAGVQLVAFLLIGMAGQSMELFLWLVAPTVLIAATAALPVGLIVLVLTRRMRAAFAEPLFLVVGGALGYFWGWAVFELWLLDRLPVLFPDVDPANFTGSRDAVAVFLMVTVGTAFYVARTTTLRASRHARPVYIGAAVIAVLTVVSGIGWAREFLG